MGSNLDPEYEQALDLWIAFGACVEIPEKQRNEIYSSFYRWLVSSIIRRALIDVEGKPPILLKDQKSAYSFLKSETCKLFCNDLGVPYRHLAIKVERLCPKPPGRKEDV